MTSDGVRDDPPSPDEVPWLGRGQGVLLQAALRREAGLAEEGSISFCVDVGCSVTHGMQTLSLRRYRHSAQLRSEEAPPPQCRGCSFHAHSLARYASSPEAPLPVRSTRLPCRSRVTIALGRETAGVFGLLNLHPPRSDTAQSEPVATAVEIAGRIGRQLRRFGAAWRLRKRLGRDLLLAGAAEALDPVDELVARASQVRLPVLLRGELGVEKEFVAAAIHFAGPSWSRPFLSMRCSDLPSSGAIHPLRQALAAARGGSLYLHGIDELDPNLQPPLSTLLEREFGLTPHGSGDLAGRLIVSSRRDLGLLVKEGALHPVLQAQLGWLVVEVPPLRRRSEDLPALTRYLLHKHGRPDLSLSDQTLHHITSYGWPGNAMELERTAARLAVMVSGGTVRRTHLDRYVPKLLDESPVGTAAGEHRVDREAVAASNREENRASEAVESLIGDLLEERFEDLGRLHPGLRKALRHVARHFQGRMTLRSLAERACLSPSHLSHLFRAHVGVSYKPFLTLLRVECARRLIAEDPHATLTRVAEQAGFGGISQFERAFKHIVGCTPRAFRRSERPS